MKNTAKTFKPTEKGQSLTELGVVMVIMAILLAGVVDLGIVMFEYITMRDAGQEGAAYASVYPTSCRQIEERVKSNLRVQDNDEVDITIQIYGVACSADAAYVNQACSPNPIEVIVSQEYVITTPFLGTLLSTNSFNLEASITDTVIRPLTCPGP
jgi:Flp pilus assembly protein TadG